MRAPMSRPHRFFIQSLGRSVHVGVCNRDGPNIPTYGSHHCGPEAERARPRLSVEQACEALGVSWDTWRAHIEPDVRLLRLGRRKLIPVSELQAWLDRHAESIGVGE
jgi:excisionase family DNA binding protein